jgi:hypothetical protein
VPSGSWIRVVLVSGAGFRSFLITAMQLSSRPGVAGI